MVRGRLSRISHRNQLTVQAWAKATQEQAGNTEKAAKCESKERKLLQIGTIRSVSRDDLSYYTFLILKQSTIKLERMLTWLMRLVLIFLLENDRSIVEI